MAWEPRRPKRYYYPKHRRAGQADFWDRQLAAAHRRCLRACETLPTVRRLRHPTLQVNIAAQDGQQVNVSGDIRLDHDNSG